MAIDDLNLEILGPHLETNVEGFKGLRSAEKFASGQSNPTFLLTAESGQYVLRSQPPGELLKSAHAVDREYRVIKALRGTEVPVARANGRHLAVAVPRGRSTLGLRYRPPFFASALWVAALAGGAVGWSLIGRRRTGDA